MDTLRTTSIAMVLLSNVVSGTTSDYDYVCIALSFVVIADLITREKK